MRYLIAGTFLLLSGIAATAQAAPAPTTYTQDQIVQLYDFPNKNAITSGYFQCLAQNQNSTAEARCLPPEIDFQEKVLTQVYNGYLNTLPADKKGQAANIEKAFYNYRNLRCDWYVQLQGDAGSVFKNKCILAMTLERRLELEQLTPAGH